jgi:coatomer subunit beta
MEFLGDSNEQAALDVLVFVREAVQRFPDLKLIVEKISLKSRS